MKSIEFYSFEVEVIVTLGAETFAIVANLGHFRESLRREKFCFGPFAKVHAREIFPDFPFFLTFFFLDRLFPPKSSLVLAQICSTSSGLFVARI